VSLSTAISAFGASVKAKLSNPAIRGEPEDQLRGPLETLFAELSILAGLPPGAARLVGETTLAGLQTRPDYAVTVNNALVGYIEVKAPRKGANPKRFTDQHDKAQWAKLQTLPNLIYTDGNSFSLWQDGHLQGDIVKLDGDVETAGSKLIAPSALLPLIESFLTWEPIPPRSPKRLAEIAARLCRFLRDEVVEQMAIGNKGLTELATDWRKLLFPEANDAQFADGYAQAVTFGLLLARARNISLASGIDQAAGELRKSNSLIGTALRLLTDDTDNQAALATSLKTLTRVLEAVDWATISKDSPDAWLYFYEDFLEVYDNALRKRTGSYYTPPQVVDAMVRLVDECLRGPVFGRPDGLASSSVTVADPAVGTGTFLLGVLRRIAATIAADEGPGAVPGAIRGAASRLYGFELQFGPFAVAQLRMIAEMQALMRTERDPLPAIPDLHLYVTDTLGNPYVEEDEWVPQAMRPVAQSRREANKVKREQPITVVIGNPPYKEKAEGRGGWIEAGSGRQDAPLDRWRPPRAWGIGAHLKHLKNLYVYFWRWATWKVFGTGLSTATGPGAVDQEGMVCFITVAGFLNGPGFERMRDDLRRTCSAIWVIDCSSEGHQPEVPTRIFQGVQQPICIVLAARTLGKPDAVPAPVRYRALPEGRREDKFRALDALSLDGPGWTECPSGWRDPFLPAASGAWAEFPALKDLFLYDGSGVMPGRTWIISPDAETLKLRWKRLTGERDVERKALLFHPHLRAGKPGDKHIDKGVREGLACHEERLSPVASDRDEVITPSRYAFRFLDRQWIIPDGRLINQPNPALWEGYSPRQLFLTALDAHSPTLGPALTFAGAIPDLHHYNGRGGRVFPLWRDREGTQPNVRPELLAHLSLFFGREVEAEEVMAYLAATMAHPAFTARFQPDLVRPGLRVPITADAALFAEASEFGREIVWLHCYGERFADLAAGRPRSAPRMAAGYRPMIPAGGEIPGEPGLPETIRYDPAKQRLHIGQGWVENVSQAMWDYEVSGKQVLPQWFSYRRRDRSRPIIGDRRPPSELENIIPGEWPAEYTSDLIDLLNVLGRLVALEQPQAELLERILAGKLIHESDLREVGALRERKDAGSERASVIT
jgi:hypothetical protein